jgi:RNA polymerase sigma-70 factor (ECF subfamily)
MRRQSVIEDLYEQYGPALVLFATALCNDRASAQDAVQQVFVNMLNRNHSTVDEPKAYLYRAVRNTVLNGIKVRDRNTELKDEPWFLAPDGNREEELSIRAALNELANEQRELVIMHVWGGLTFAEIADLLGISINTATSRYRYALANLREYMTARKTNATT